MLSSPLGEDFLQRTQRRVPVVAPLARLAWQALKLLALWAGGKLRAPAGPAPEAVIFTYVDRQFRGGPDPFFGALAHELPVRSRHIAFIHGAYRARLPAGYDALYGSLGLGDLAWALAASLAAWWRAGRYEAPPATQALRAALRWDIGQGGYFYNLLVYRAARRLLARWRPRWIIYPFEMKALEKMLLLAAREAVPECRLVGYQHAAVSARHTALFLAQDEAAATPLPDRIVTLGEATRSYLEAHGGYPAGIFVTGCALRQSRGPLLPRRPRGSPQRLLLALSGSRRELAQAVAICRHVPQEIAIRAHPEFPVRLLPRRLRAWAQARDVSREPLASSLEWCDALVYVSTTVAIEALARGRPIITLRIGDLIDPDPVLEALALRWHARDAQDLARAAREMALLDDEDFERRRREALAYAERYFAPVTPQALRAFLPEARARTPRSSAP